MNSEPQKINLENIAKIVTSFLFFAYAMGFVAWNVHLGKYGYFESDLLQTRFLSTGILAMCILTVPLFLIFLTVRKIKMKSELKLLFVPITFFVFLIIFFMVFTRTIFPKIPQAFGGSYPFVKRLIADPIEIDFLSNFNISSEINSDKRPVETVPLCEIYSNRDISIIGTIGPYGENLRVLTLLKENIKGFQAIPPYVDTLVNKDLCDKFY